MRYSEPSADRDWKRLGVPKTRIAEFCRRRRVRTLSLFGSVLRDDFGQDSDVDVLVEFETNAGVSLFDLVDMQQELRDMLGREVDLVERKGLRNPFRRHGILSGSRVLYAG